MSFETLYRVSFYAMLVLAALVMSVDVADDDRLAILYPLGVALASAVAFATVDRKPSLGLPRWAGNVLSLGSVALLFFEYSQDKDQLLLALGHWLIYLQLVLIFRVKTVETDWWLYSLGLVEVLIGSVVSQSDTVGLTLFAWSVLALWVFGLFALQREAGRARAANSGRGVAGAGRGALYPGLFTPQFVVSALRVTLTTLALGGVIFLAMPRRSVQARPQGTNSSGQHLTGFDDEVKLGQMGEILENDDVVMSVELFDDEGNRLSPTGLQQNGSDEPLWRGVTLSIYDEGKWTRQGRNNVSTLPLILPDSLRKAATPRPARLVRQQIKLEANDSSVLFALRPVLETSSPGRRANSPDLNPVDGSIFRNDVRGGAYDYEVRSYRDLSLPQPGENDLGGYRKGILLGVPPAARPRLQAIADSVLEGLAPADRGDPLKKARALEAYLRDSGKFGYTLKLTVVDPALDPVVDFLDNRKEGHCEYFASALTLLLRASGVPARLVNGFKGGDWNDLAQVMSVRQKHAHSWVEAYLGTAEGSDRSPLWLTLDPTPGNERSQSVAAVGGVSSRFRQLTDFVRYAWVFYIVGYNADRQNRLIYGPLKQLVSEARRGFGMMGQAADVFRERLARLLHFSSAESLISVRGFAVSFVGLALIVGSVRLTFWLLGRLRRWYRGADDDPAAALLGAAHYRRLAQLLARFGLERPPAETQDEFARRAALVLAARGSTAWEVSDVPKEVVDAYYRVRFGQLDIPPERLKALEERLDALETALAPAGR